MKIYDISQEIFSCCTYPGDPKPQKEFLSLMRSYVNWLLYKILYRKTKIEK